MSAILAAIGFYIIAIGTAAMGVVMLRDTDGDVGVGMFVVAFIIAAIGTTLLFS